MYLNTVAAWLRVALISVALLSGITGEALAGPPEELDQVAVHPTNPDILAMRYVNGGEGIVYRILDENRIEREMAMGIMVVYQREGSGATSKTGSGSAP